jgi:predicted CopG family antitoxin
MHSEAREHAMRRKLTITIADDVYRGLHHHVGRGEISHFIEDLVRPHVVTDSSLEAEYREAAQDEQAEKEALEWIEACPDDALD